MKLSNIKLIAICLIVQMGISSAYADEVEKAYEASLSLGYVGTSGNTDTQTYNTEFLMAYNFANWLHNIKFQGMGTQENSSTTAERYFLEDKSDYELSDDQYLFVKVNYLADRFSGYDSQTSLAAGYGRYFYKQDNFSFQGFAGVGYRQSEIADAGTEGEAILSVGENLKWKISESSSVTHSLTSEIGQDITVTVFEIGLVSNIIDRIATKIAFQARNTSDVPEGKEKTDTQTSISLVYAF